MKTPNGIRRIAHYNRLAPNTSTNETEECIRVIKMIADFEAFMAVYTDNGTARYNITWENGSLLLPPEKSLQYTLFWDGTAIKEGAV